MFLRYFKLAVWVVLFEGIGSFLGRLNDVHVDTWYQDIVRSQLTPPDITFGIVWSILYVILAIVAWYLFHEAKRVSPWVKGIFVLQMLLNFSWTPLFFIYHQLLASFVVLCLMVVLNAILIVQLRTINKLAALGIALYWLWLCFATYLSGVIWFYN